MDGQNQLQSDTKSRIMNAAESLFATNGFKGTSIKRLAGKARVNQAAINYHFGSKAGLMEKVIERRLSQIYQLCLQRLQTVRQAAAENGRRPLVEDVLSAFFEPAFAMNAPVQEKRWILAISGRALFEPNTTIRAVFFRNFKPLFMLLLRSMREALPDLPQDVLIRRLHFAVGTITHCLRLSSINLPPPDLFPPVDDLKKIANLLLDFVASGMKAPYHREGEDMFKPGNRQYSH